MWVVSLRSGVDLIVGFKRFEDSPFTPDDLYDAVFHWVGRGLFFHGDGSVPFRRVQRHWAESLADGEAMLDQLRFAFRSPAGMSDTSAAAALHCFTIVYVALHRQLSKLADRMGFRLSLPDRNLTELLEQSIDDLFVVHEDDLYRIYPIGDSFQLISDETHRAPASLPRSRSESVQDQLRERRCDCFLCLRLRTDATPFHITHLGRASRHRRSHLWFYRVRRIECQHGTPELRSAVWEWSYRAVYEALQEHDEGRRLLHQLRWHRDECLAAMQDDSDLNQICVLQEVEAARAEAVLSIGAQIQRPELDQLAELHGAQLLPGDASVGALLEDNAVLLGPLYQPLCRLAESRLEGVRCVPSGPGEALPTSKVVTVFTIDQFPAMAALDPWLTVDPRTRDCPVWVYDGRIEFSLLDHLPEERCERDFSGIFSALTFLSWSGGVEPLSDLSTLRNRWCFKFGCHGSASVGQVATSFRQAGFLVRSAADVLGAARAYEDEALDRLDPWYRSLHWPLDVAARQLASQSDENRAQALVALALASREYGAGLWLLHLGHALRNLPSLEPRLRQAGIDASDHARWREQLATVSRFVGREKIPLRWPSDV